MLNLNNRQLDSLTATFGILADKTRFKILKTLLSKGEICVSDVAKDVGVSLSAASHQLNKLEIKGIVSSKRYGQTICYCLKNERSKKMIRKLINLKI